MAISTPGPREQAEPARTAVTQPSGLVRSMSEEMDRFFHDFAPLRWPFTMHPFHPREGFWAPAIEVLDLAGRVVVRAELAGLAPKDVKVEVRPGVLTISGERRQTSEDIAGNSYRSERTYGRFQRTIALPDTVDMDTAKATFDQGVLEVSFRAAAPVSRALPIEEKAAGQS